MDYTNHKDYFIMSYQNGADIWTHLPSKIRNMRELVSRLPQGASILDLGSGRGLIAKHLAEMGFKVVGVDFEGDVVHKANEEISNWGLSNNLQFIEADIFHLPFEGQSFDAVCDFGLLENLHTEDWAPYAREINRVLKAGGLYLSLTLSRKTKNFLNFSPINSSNGEYDHLGLHYHFFDQEELVKIFAPTMTFISDHIDFIDEPREVTLLQTLFQKNK